MISVPPSLPPRRLGALAGAPHAIPYQGSKRLLAHAIAPLLPADTARLLEPFAGSAAVAIAARHLGIGRSAEISDINEPLMALWRRILDEPAALGADYDRLWTEQLADPRGYYEQVRAAFNHGHEPHHLLYLLARCVKAAVRYNREGEFNQGADHRRLGARPALMRSRLLATARVLAGTRAHVADYAQVLAGAERADVVYLDPPYQGVTGTRDHRYVTGVPRAAVVEQLARAVDRGTSFLLSYDGSSGERRYGDPLPADLGLLHLSVSAGPSSQATLNGTDAHTVESIYLSPALVGRLGGADAVSRSLVGSAASG
jgi:DNA adenine methylase